MGAIGSVLSAAQVVGGVIGKNAERRQSKKEDQLALSQLRQSQDLQMAQARTNADLDRQQIDLETANSEEERKAALRRAVARQRANFGAQGVGAGTGSSQAVLLGLFEESEDEMARRASLDKLRLNTIDENLSQSNAINVLQRTQLQERSKVGNLARNIKFGRDLVDIGNRVF